MGNPLLIGPAPGRRFQGQPFVGAGSGNRIDQLVGPFRIVLERENLVPIYVGGTGTGDAFPLAYARRVASMMDLSGRPFIILAGVNVARAFGVEPTFLTWQTLRGVPAAVIPHPSGRNRWWNDQAKTERVREFLRTAFATWKSSSSLI